MNKQNNAVMCQVFEQVFHNIVALYIESDHYTFQACFKLSKLPRWSPFLSFQLYDCTVFVLDP